MNVRVESAKIYHAEHERPGFIYGCLRLKWGKAGLARGRGLDLYLVPAKLEVRRQVLGVLFADAVAGGGTLREP